MSEQGRKEIRRPLGLQITSREDCSLCMGSGLKLTQEHEAYANRIEVSISVCPCVRLARKSPQPNQHTRKQEEQ